MHINKQLTIPCHRSLTTSADSGTLFTGGAGNDTHNAVIGTNGLVANGTTLNRENCIALGPAGTGKTHTALALGLAACQKNYSTLFVTAAALVHELMEAQWADSSISELMAKRFPCSAANMVGWPSLRELINASLGRL